MNRSIACVSSTSGYLGTKLVHAQRASCRQKRIVKWMVHANANVTTGKVELNKAPPTPITLTDAALNHLKKLKTERGQEKAVLRVGVKSGGCSGMSYAMDFISSPEEERPDDTVLAFEAGEIELRIDPKSLLYLFGLRLDYSSELIGGGYKFYNPNATSSCGCGTSFNV